MPAPFTRGKRGKTNRLIGSDYLPPHLSLGCPCALAGILDAVHPLCVWTGRDELRLTRLRQFQSPLQGSRPAKHSRILPKAGDSSFETFRGGGGNLDLVARLGMVNGDVGVDLELGARIALAGCQNSLCLFFRFSENTSTEI